MTKTQSSTLIVGIVLFLAIVFGLPVFGQLWSIGNQSNTQPNPETSLNDSDNPSAEANPESAAAPEDSSSSGTETEDNQTTSLQVQQEDVNSEKNHNEVESDKSEKIIPPDGRGDYEDMKGAYSRDII